MATELWDRRDDESPGAYRAFSTYLEMGHGRTLEAYANRNNEQVQGKKRAITGRIGKYATDHEWVKRAAAYDAHQAAQRRKGAEQQAVKEGIYWEAKRADHYLQTLADAELIAEKARQLVRAFPVGKRVLSSDGKTVLEPLPSVDIRRAADILETAQRMRQSAIDGACPQPEASHGIPQKSPRFVGVIRSGVNNSNGHTD